MDTFLFNKTSYFLEYFVCYSSTIKVSTKNYKHWKHIIKFKILENFQTNFLICSLIYFSSNIAQKQNIWKICTSKTEKATCIESNNNTMKQNNVPIWNYTFFLEKCS